MSANRESLKPTIDISLYWFQFNCRALYVHHWLEQVSRASCHLVTSLEKSEWAGSTSWCQQAVLKFSLHQLDIETKIHFCQHKWRYNVN